jgi:hypothetical protein
MRDLIKTLEDLPDGVFIAEDGFYSIKGGKVSTGDLKSLSDPEPSQELGTINDPKNGNQS